LSSSYNLAFHLNIYSELNTFHCIIYTLKMLGCFNPTLGQIWTNPNVGLKMSLKNETQWLSLSIFDPKMG